MKVWEIVEKGWICTTLLGILGYVIMTQSAATEDSEAEHKGTNNRRKTFWVSGRAQRVRCFWCGNPRDHDPQPQSNFIVGPTGRPPQRTATTNPSFRPNRRQNKISNQQASSVAAAQQFPPLSQQQQTEEGATNDTLPPFVPGLRVDWLKNFLKAILSPEDYEKYSARLELPPKKEETTIYQDLATKVKEHGQIFGQVEHLRNVVRDDEAKLHKQQRLLQELSERSQNLKREIDMLQAQVAAAASSSQVIPPMHLPGNPPAGSPPPLHSSGDIPSDIQIEEVEEGR